jgi:carbamoyl-phosphate synthase small subunit
LKLSETDAVKAAVDWEGLDNQDYAYAVSTKEPYLYCNKGKHNVIVIDYGVKTNILKLLSLNDMKVTVLPAKSSAKDILSLKPDGVCLANGPADPKALVYAIDAAKNLIGKVPLFGICLGHQILGIALGIDCSRLKFGHHGANHPVKDLETNKVSITSQNHNYALDRNKIPAGVELTHINLNDNTVEGIRHAREPLFSVQYHPEASPGPNDSTGLFEKFKNLMER